MRLSQKRGLTIVIPLIVALLIAIDMLFDPGPVVASSFFAQYEGETVSLANVPNITPTGNPIGIVHNFQTNDPNYTCFINNNSKLLVYKGQSEYPGNYVVHVWNPNCTPKKDGSWIFSASNNSNDTGVTLTVNSIQMISKGDNFGPYYKMYYSAMYSGASPPYPVIGSFGAGQGCRSNCWMSNTFGFPSLSTLALTLTLEDNQNCCGSGMVYVNINGSSATDIIHVAGTQNKGAGCGISVNGLPCQAPVGSGKASFNTMGTSGTRTAKVSISVQAQSKIFLDNTAFFGGKIVSLANVPNITPKPGFFVWKVTNFQTNDPNYTCFNGSSLDVYNNQSGYPANLVAHSWNPSCSPRKAGTWIFSILPPPPPPDPQKAQVGIGVCSIHDNGINSNTFGYGVDVILAASAAGCRYVRIDVSFTNVMQGNGQINQFFLDSLGMFASTAVQQGIGVIPALLPDGDVLFGHWYPCGLWNLGRCYQDAQIIEPAWKNFVTDVAREFGPNVTYYQVLNEPNNFLADQIYDPIYNPLTNPNPGLNIDGDLKAISDARQALQSQNPAARVIVNVNTEVSPGLWLIFLEKIAGTIDIAAIDHYPGSWNPLDPPSDWSPLTQLFSAVNNHKNPLYRKQTAVMETGFPTACIPGLSTCNNLTQDAQKAFIQSAIPTIKGLAQVQNNAHPDGGRFLFLGWYELMDSGGSCLDFCGDWGVLNKGIWADWPSLKKNGFDSLAKKLAPFQ